MTSLGRAFTTRRAKQSMDLKDAPQRSNTVTRSLGPTGSIRHKISAPVELTHTTNMLAYNAPDLYPLSASSTTSSFKASDDESDGGQTSTSSPPTSPDIPSRGHRSSSPELNHLSCYFTMPGQKLSAPVSEAPIVPQRAPSHTKKASYENLARKQSARYSNQSNKTLSTKSSFSLSLSRSSSTSTTATSVSSGSFNRGKPATLLVPSSYLASPVTPSVPTRQLSLRRSESTAATHAFGQELAQVSELAEDSGAQNKPVVLTEEEQELVAKGLCRFRAEDYLIEVQGLFTSFFKEEEQRRSIWI